MRSPFARLSIPAKITGAYAAITAAWILLGNGAIRRFLDNPAWNRLTEVLFLAATALVLYAGLWRLVARFEAVETALRLSDERWQFALEGSGEGVWDWDAETEKVFYSSRWKAMLGYAEAEIGDQPEAWVSRIHPEDRARTRRRFLLHLLGKTPAFVCEHRMRTKAGAYIWVLSRGQVLRWSADGRPLRAIGTQSDVTARKDAETRMADALSFNQTILRSSPVAIVAYTADGQTISANEAAVVFFGTTAEGLLRQNFRQLDLWRRHGLLEAADRALKENTVVRHATQVVDADGRPSWCDLTFTPFLFEGEPRLLLMGQDTTQQHATLERLELLDAALAATPTGWVVTDAKGLIEWVNPGFTRLTGYTLAEASGRTLNLLKSGRHAPSFYANLWQAIGDGQIWQGELCNRHKSGSLYYERMTIAPVRDAGGAITHYVAMKEDVTGRHELEQQLARSQRLESIGLLASGIAHDLNNMLAPIMLAISLIKSRHGDRETLELLDMMQGAAQRGAGVVQQVLTFARGVEGERVQVDVRPLVKELAQLARETFPREIRVTVEVPATALLVEGDITQLHQVLLNLAVNARDAMPRGGVLALQAAAKVLDEAGARQAPAGKAGNYVALTVADTGGGIPPEVIEHIFEPFFTTKPRGKGSGLGLSTAYGIVRSHGGFLDVKSTPGTGTQFTVLVPASVKPELARGAQRGRAPRIVGAGRRVLVVDDEASIRLVIGRVLEKLGFAPVEAEDGLHGLKQLLGAPDGFSAAILDLMMPGMNGYNLTREIRRVAPALPIIVVSGMMGDRDVGEDRTLLGTLGVRVVLMKPFSESDLLEALHSEMGAPG